MNDPREKMLPCPFCGEEVKFIGSTAFNNCTAKVECQCGASITARESGMWLTSDGRYKADCRAIENWNQRTVLPELAQWVIEMEAEVSRLKTEYAAVECQMHEYNQFGKQYVEEKEREIEKLRAVAETERQQKNPTAVKCLNDIELEIVGNDEIPEDERLTSLSIYECCTCHWRFTGDCERTGHGYDLEGTQMPNYCPMCGAKITDYVE